MRRNPTAAGLALVALFSGLCSLLGILPSPACDDFVVSKAGLSYMLASALAGGRENVPPGPAHPTFPDVPTDHWAYRYVEYLVPQGVFAGEAGGSFAPKTSPSRGSAAKYVARAWVAPGGDAAIPDPPPAPTFVDVQSDHEAYRYVEYLYSMDLPIACASGPVRFCPDDVTSALALWSWMPWAPDPCTIPPTAYLTASAQSGLAPLIVEFSDESVDGPLSWSWDFGDGSTSTEQSPTHSYLVPGLYLVSLTVANEGGQNTFTAGTAILVSYPDVPLDFWALGAILGCSDAGIVYGYEDGLYHPQDSVTRDQMATYIARAVAGGDEFVPTGPSTNHFPDVPTEYWAYKYIEHLWSLGIVSGYVDGYRPTEPVDRGQMAVYVSRAEAGGDTNVPPGPVTPTFADVPPTFWAYRHVEYCVDTAVVQGYDDGLYHPEVTVTRDQMAVYVARAFGLL